MMYETLPKTDDTQTKQNTTQQVNIDNNNNKKFETFVHCVFGNFR